MILLADLIKPNTLILVKNIGQDIEYTFQSFDNIFNIKTFANSSCYDNTRKILGDYKYGYTLVCDFSLGNFTLENNSKIFTDEKIKSLHKYFLNLLYLYLDNKLSNITVDCNKQLFLNFSNFDSC